MRHMEKIISWVVAFVSAAFIAAGVFYLSIAVGLQGVPSRHQPAFDLMVLLGLVSPFAGFICVLARKKNIALVSYVLPMVIAAAIVLYGEHLRDTKNHPLTIQQQQ